MSRRSWKAAVAAGAAVALAVAVALEAGLLRADEPEKGLGQARQAPKTTPSQPTEALEAPKSALSAERDNHDGGELEDTDHMEEGDDEGEADREREGEDDEERPTAFGANTLVTLRPAVKRIPASGRLTIEITNANAFAVSGKLSGATTKRVTLRARGRKRRIKLDAKRFSVDANARKTVKLKLPKKLRGRRRPKLTLIATVADPGGTTRTVKKHVSPS